MSLPFVHRRRLETVLTCDYRVRYQVQNARPLDFSVESKKLADLIQKYSLQENSLFVN